MTTFHLADLLEGVADQRADATALICGEQRLSYRELEQRAAELAYGLVQQGVAPGDHVGIYMANCVEFVESLLACFKAGAIAININYRYVGDELRYLFNDAELKAVIFQRQYRDSLLAVRDDCPSLQTLIELAPIGAAPETAADIIDYRDLSSLGCQPRQQPARDEMDHYLLYTGGTTGMPKGVIWPHRHLFFRALGGGGIMGDGPVDSPEQLLERAQGGLTTLLGSPLMHGASQWTCLMMLLAGNTVVLSDSPNFDADNIWQLVEQHRVNSLSIVGDAMARPLIDALQQDIDSGRPRELSSLWVIGSGGALFSMDAQDSLQQLLPDISIFNGFGSSESGVHGRSERTNEEGLIEINVTDSTALISDSGQIIADDSRELGVIAFCGNTPIGYYNDPLKTAKTFVEVDEALWVLTGDRGRYTDSGTIVMMGRDSGCINTGGEKVFAEEVESVLKGHPAVYDCLVVGVPDTKFGNRVTALIQLRQQATLTLDELKTHCRQQLSGYKLPREMIAVEYIEREPNGKPNYRWAKATAAA